MEQISSTAFRDKSVIGLFGYSRGFYSAEGYQWEGLHRYIQVLQQLSPHEFLVAHLHIDPRDGVISHEVLSLDQLRQCVFYDRHEDIQTVADYYLQRAIGAKMH